MAALKIFTPICGGNRYQEGDGHLMRPLNGGGHPTGVGRMYVSKAILLPPRSTWSTVKKVFDGYDWQKDNKWRSGWSEECLRKKKEKEKKDEITCKMSDRGGNDGFDPTADRPHGKNWRRRVFFFSVGLRFHGHIR